MLPTTGPITLQMIAAEFGGAAPHNLSEYYAGGPYVPTGTSGINGPIPSSGIISLWHFRGATAAVTWEFTAQNYISYSGIHTCGYTGEVPQFGTWNTGSIDPGGPPDGTGGLTRGTISIPAPLFDGNTYGLGHAFSYENTSFGITFVRNPFVAPVVSIPFNSVTVSGPGISGGSFTLTSSNFNFTVPSPWELYATTNTPGSFPTFIDGQTYQVIFT